MEQPPTASFATVTFEPEPGTEVYGEKVETTLYRDEGGLGFSIAGGRGSVPFKGNDNVRGFYCHVESVSHLVTHYIRHANKDQLQGPT